jgi:uncharacterized SAM-binding protein YcdF (DUF218 family)
MPFALSKALGFLLHPSTLAALALAAGLWLTRGERRSKLGRRLAWGGLAYFVVCGLLPVGNALILPLEQRFADVPAPGASDRLAGIIILGGFEDGWVSAGRRGLALNESSERLTEGVRLALAHPEAKVVFTGASGWVWPGGVDSTGPVSAFLRDVGIDEGRFVLEGRSRNTSENARLTAELLNPTAGERWVLVTSAYHMPRAVGLYRKAGFDVIPYPVDYRTRGWEDLLRPFERIPAGLMRTDLAAVEWIGLAAYWMLGRTDELFPGP